MIFFSAETMGFYLSGVSKDIPCNAKPESEWTISYDELLKLQSEGYKISPDANGNPIAEKVNTGNEEVSHALLSQKLTEASKQIAILSPAVDGGYAKPEHTKLLADWQRFRYELTLVPEQPGWPGSPQWPTEPEKVI